MRQNEEEEEEEGECVFVCILPLVFLPPDLHLHLGPIALIPSAGEQDTIAPSNGGAPVLEGALCGVFHVVPVGVCDKTHVSEKTMR